MITVSFITAIFLLSFAVQPPTLPSAIGQNPKRRVEKSGSRPMKNSFFKQELFHLDFHHSTLFHLFGCVVVRLGLRTKTSVFLIISTTIMLMCKVCGCSWSRRLQALVPDVAARVWRLFTISFFVIPFISNRADRQVRNST